MKAALFLCSLAICGGKLLRQSPDEQALNAEFKETDSFGNTELEPPCSKIECGEYECPPPFKLKTDATCCGYCWAPDHVVPAHRNAVQFNATGNVVAQCDSAPSSCRAPSPTVVRCFTPQCRPGEKAHCSPGACCAQCSV